MIPNFTQMKELRLTTMITTVTAKRCRLDTNRRCPSVECTDLRRMLESFRFPTTRSMATCGRKVPGCSKPRWMTVCPREDPGLRLRGREEGGLQADGGKREATVQCVPALYTLPACDWSSRRHVITNPSILLVYYALVISTMYAYDYDNIDHPRVSPCPQLIAK